MADDTSPSSRRPLPDAVDPEIGQRMMDALDPYREGYVAYRLVGCAIVATSVAVAVRDEAVREGERRVADVEAARQNAEDVARELRRIIKARDRQIADLIGGDV